MSNVKLLKDFNQNDLLFKPVRKTSTGSRIIDIETKVMYQTPWLKILYDVEYSICLDSEKIKEILDQLDKIIIDQCSNSLEFTKEEILKMYKPLSRSNDCFYAPIGSNTVLFDNTRNFYDKPEIKNTLKQGHDVRIIFVPKKIYFKDYEIIVPLEVQQIELA